MFEIHAEEHELREEGLTQEEIADVIAGRGTPERSESGLLDMLLGDEAALARHQRLLDEEAISDEDDDE